MHYKTSSKTTISIKKRQTEEAKTIDKDKHQNDNINQKKKNK
jgi:hypothetical protein